VGIDHRNHPAQIAFPPLAALVIALSAPSAIAEEVYKCVVNGKVNYTANPTASSGSCQPTAIRNDGPSPEEYARLLEDKKLRQEQDRKAEEAALKEREVRAKELEAHATARRAQVAEEQLELLRQSSPYDPDAVYYPQTYPYYYGGTGYQRPQPLPGNSWQPGNGWHPPTQQNKPPPPNRAVIVR
jgi:hypothetical protein